MPINVLMPALSPTMEKGNLAKWLKKEGDTIKSGDVIAEIETDKATMEVEAVDEGMLAKIVVPEGTADVPVNELIALIAGEGEDPKSVIGAAAARAAPAARPPKSAGAAPARAAAAAAAPLRSGRRRQSAARGADGPQPAAQAQRRRPGRARLRVAAREAHRARRPGIDLAASQGSGPHGRVVEKDVRAALAGGGAEAGRRGSAGAAPRPPRPQPPRARRRALRPTRSKPFFEPGSYEEIPHDACARRSRERLIESKQTIPHFYLTLDCELDALLALREQINAAARRTRTASRPTRSRSTTSSSRRWPSR